VDIPDHTLRVTYSYGDGGLRLDGVTRVEMRTRAPVGPPPGDDGKGYWLAVENEAGQVVYHVPLHDPLRGDVELYTHPDEPPARRANAGGSGTFEVLAPDIPGGGKLVLHGPSAEPASARFLLERPNRRLVEHDLQALRDLAAGGRAGPQGAAS
jgi:hypothetical protein